MLTRDDILKQTRLPVEPVQAFGGTVFVRTMSGTERDSWEQAQLDTRKTGRLNVRGSFAARVLCDEQGKRLFTDADAATLGNLSAADLDRVWEVGTRLNGIGTRDVKELEGNSGAAQSGASTSDSPSPSA
jgi:hypothetical protein